MVERTLELATSTLGEFDFPHIQQYGILHTKTLEISTGKVSNDTHAIITSIPRERGAPQLLLDCFRKEWCIENSSHYVRDVTFGEDRCRMRTGNAARVLATFRNLAISIIHLAGGDETVAQTLRRGVINPRPLFQAFGLALGTDLSIQARSAFKFAA